MRFGLGRFGFGAFWYRLSYVFKIREDSLQRVMKPSWNCRRNGDFQ